MDWYLDLWRPHAAHGGYLDTPSPYIEDIMTSHLGVCDAEMASLHQISKMSAMNGIPLGMDIGDILNSLYHLDAPCPSRPGAVEVNAATAPQLWRAFQDGVHLA